MRRISRRGFFKMALAVPVGLTALGRDIGVAEEKPPILAPETSTAPHWSLGLYMDYLRRLRVPDSPFDPRGAWEHTYDVFPVYGALDVTGKAWSERHKGKLRIRREPVSGDGGVRLSVFSEVTFLDLGTLPTKYQRTSAVLACRDDQLATPMHWELTSAAIGKEDGCPRPLSEIQETGRLQRENVELQQSAGNRSFPVGKRVATNWGLFDAVQRLSGEMDLSFTMLEDLRLVRREQRLLPEAPVEVAFANRKVSLWGFRQTGEGVLPIHWWRDEHGRVLLALGNVRAYIWRGGVAAHG